MKKERSVSQDLPLRPALCVGFKAHAKRESHNALRENQSWWRPLTMALAGCFLLFPACSLIGADRPDAAGAAPAIKSRIAGGSASQPAVKTAGKTAFGLEQAVRTALDSDPRLYSGHWQAEAARHGVALAWRGNLPQITASGNYGYEKRDYTSGGPQDTTEEGEKQDTDFGSNNSKYGIDLSWTVFEFGAGSHRIDAARDRAAGTVFQEARSRDLVIFDTVKAYFDLFRIRQLLVINQQNRIAHRELTKVVQARVQQKQAAPVRMQEAELRLQELEGEREELFALENDAVEAYRLTTGVEPAAELAEPLDPKQVPAFGADNIDSLIEQMKQHNPELIALRKDIDAQRHDVEAARREHLPKVSLYSGYSYRTNDYNTYTNGADYNDLEAGVKISMPLFGQQIGETVDMAVARREAQIGQYNRLLRETERNARVAVDTMQSLKVRQGQLEENARSAAKLAEARGEQFKMQSMGDDSVLAMSNALQQRFRSEAAAFNTRLKFRLSAYSLESAIGRLVQEFVEPGTQYTDMTASTDQPMDVPRESWLSRVDDKRYEPLPQATESNGLKIHPLCILGGKRYQADE